MPTPRRSRAGHSVAKPPSKGTSSRARAAPPTDDLPGPIPGLPLQQSAYDRILRSVLTGSIPAGARLHAGQLAAAMETSVTPVREALFALASEGILTVLPRHGFRVPELSLAEVRDLYAIIGTLEELALRSSGPRTEAQLTALRRITQELRTVQDDPALALATDDRWHTTLHAECSNRVLLALLGQVKRRARRYDYAYMRSGALRSQSAAEHDRIVRALVQHRVEEAAAALHDHWSTAAAAFARWLPRDSAARPSARPEP